MAPNDLKWAKNDLWAKDSEFLPNSDIETQKTQKFGVNSEILTPLEPLLTHPRVFVRFGKTKGEIWVKKGNFRGDFFFLGVWTLFGNKKKVFVF